MKTIENKLEKILAIQLLLSLAWMIVSLIMKVFNLTTIEFELIVMPTIIVLTLILMFAIGIEIFKKN